MRHALIFTLVCLVAAPLAAQVASPEASFIATRDVFLARVIGHEIDPTSAREYLAENGIEPDRLISAAIQIEGIENVSHVLNDEGNTLPGTNTATLRFRARLFSVSEAQSEVSDAWENQNRADILFTVIFVQRGDRWEKAGSSAIWDVEHFLPPNDIRYAMRPFTNEISARLNSLPDFP